MLLLRKINKSYWNFDSLPKWLAPTWIQRA